VLHLQLQVLLLPALQFLLEGLYAFQKLFLTFLEVKGPFLIFDEHFLIGNDFRFLLDGFLFQFVILIFKAGNVQIQILNAFVELVGRLLHGSDFLFIKVVIDFEICL
jgi:hypothetical protein